MKRRDLGDVRSRSLEILQMQNSIRRGSLAQEKSARVRLWSKRNPPRFNQRFTEKEEEV